MAGDQGNKAIYFAVGILLTAGLITMIVFMFMGGSKMFNKASSKITSMDNAITEADFGLYNNKPVSGSAAENAIRVNASKTFTVVVKTNRGTAKSYNSPSEYGLVDSTDPNFIEPTGTFDSVLDKDANGTIIGMTLTQRAT